MLRYSDPIPLSNDEKSDLLAFAVQISRDAGAATLPLFRANIQAENKLSDGRFDPVTQADRMAEQILRDAIRVRYPEHGIFGEEFGHTEGNGLTWVIDPIDGTRAFMGGFVHWGVLVGLFDGQRSVIGVMYQPFTEEVFLGSGGNSEYRRGGDVRALRCSATTALADAILATTSPQFFRSGSERESFHRLEDAVKVSRYGGDCYLYAMLAMGQVDIAIDAGLNPYDIQALIPVIEGAGGLVTTASGEDASMGGLIVAAATPELHARTLAVLDQS
jgi:myo-inositol-1(or 4)-monophosphatase